MILFIDDEEKYVENVLEELKLLGRDVEFCSGVDVAFGRIRAIGSAIEIIVCDVMMPHGDSFSREESDDGRLTGLRFLDRLRSMDFTRPVVLLTNLEPGRAEVVDAAPQRYPPCTVIRKREKWSYEIAEMINKMVKHG